MNRSYIIKEMYENIEAHIIAQGKPNGGLFGTETNDFYSEETLCILNEASKIMKIGEIYANRLHKFFEGDDGEESLKIRLLEDLTQLEISEKEKQFK